MNGSAAQIIAKRTNDGIVPGSDEWLAIETLIGYAQHRALMKALEDLSSEIKKQNNLLQMRLR